VFGQVSGHHVARRPPDEALDPTLIGPPLLQGVSTMAGGLPLSSFDGGHAEPPAQLCTPYLPPIWGWFALSWLRKTDYV
jgi:hypothetical protein